MKAIRSPHRDPQRISEPSRLVYLRISGVLLSGADVGVMLTLTCDPRRDMLDGGVAASRTAAARPPLDDDAPKP